MDKRVIVITGPTATGKTKVAIEVAKRSNGEIISADSMLVYRGMDIGTAKPTREERDGIPHHLIDIINPNERFSVAEFQEKALNLCRQIKREGKLPIIVGGTALYINSIVKGYVFAPNKPDWQMRQQFQDFVETKGKMALHERLQAVDPIAAQKIHSNDVKRVIRALEVVSSTGKPLSEQGNKKMSSEFTYIVHGLNSHRDILYDRINKRVDEMITQGLEEEVKKLINRDYSRDLFSMNSLGYKQMIAYLEGECDLEEAIYLIKRDTRRFSKRQMTWWRKENNIYWHNIAHNVDLQMACEKIANRLQESYTD